MNATVGSTSPPIKGGKVQVWVDPGYQRSSKLVAALQDAALYDHAVDAFQVIETHISWVLLTGPYAYKIKKPVRFGFLDFSSLSLRKQYCEEELRLNSRYAPQLYQAIIPVTGSIEHPRLDGQEEAIEYLVKMRQFSQHNLLSHLAENGELQPPQIDEMADVIAAHHAQAQPASEDMVYGTLKSISKWVNENFSQVWPLLKDRELIDHFVELQDWSDRELEKHWHYMRVRKHAGFVRECHGDLHLGNMALIDNQVTLFDCIEFNPELRWIDVISEVAFVMMDLQQRGYPRLAWRFINRYLQQTGDYDGLKLLRYYLAYRALVRAKVAALRIRQPGNTTTEAAAIWKEVTEYTELALLYINTVRPVILLMHGFSGSGKSTLAGKLAESLGAFQVRSDIERKRLYGHAVLDRTDSNLDSGIYTPEATLRTYGYLEELTEKIINAGFPIIVDASLLHDGVRVQFKHLAKILSVPCLIIDCTAPVKILRKRVRQRARLENDPSEATLNVLEKQLTSADPLSEKERAYTVTVDTGKEVAIEALSDQIRKRVSCARYSR